MRSRALRWGVTLALLAYAISQLSADQIVDIAGWNSVALLFVSSVVLVVVVGLNTVRWLLIARICRVQMRWRQSFQWTMIGHFFNQIFPSSVGGDVVRGMLAGRGIDDMGGAFSSIALERIVGFIALLALIAIGQPLLIARLHDQSLSHFALAAVLLSLGLLAAVFVVAKFVGDRRSGRLQAAAQRFASDTRRLMASPQLTGAALLVSFVMHGSNLVLTAAVANLLGADISLLDVLLVVPTIILIASLPISIGGWGVREAALAVGFSALGQPISVAVATSLIIGLANLVSALPGAIAWNWLPPAERSSHDTRQS
ncbi:MAG TPA: lysylphosphatidylglycerol synthase transmembrane domain-containing protein [Xanthobacteraceae bacterium]